MSTSGTSHPLRRYLRFSVRSLIVLVLLIGGWLGWLVHSARSQREAVAALRKQAIILYDWEWQNGRLSGRREPFREARES